MNEMLVFLQNNPQLYVIVLGVIGAVTGSFLNVVIYRLPLMLKSQWRYECLEYLEQQTNADLPSMNLLFPRSHCPSCEKPVAFYHNIPLLSYILLAGRCSNCQTRIPFVYFLVELLTAVTFSALAFQYGVSIECLFSALFVSVMIALVFIDLKHHLLPDALTLPMIWIGLILSTYEVFIPADQAIMGAAIGYLSLWIMAAFFRLLLRKEAMGYGDFKLFAVIGAWCGYGELPLVLICASLMGSVVGLTLMATKKLAANRQIAFGPYLALAGIGALLSDLQNILYFL